MIAKQQVNIRLPQHTIEQIKALQEQSGMTQTQVMIWAIDRLAQSELKKEKA